MTDHVHMCIEIAPKFSVASVIGFLKGKSAMQIARQFGGRERNYTGEHFLGARLRCLNCRARCGGGARLHSSAGSQR